jgi:hypothetical protein
LTKPSFVIDEIGVAQLPFARLGVASLPDELRVHVLVAVRAFAGLKARLREASGLGLSKRHVAVDGVRRVENAGRWYGGRLTGRLEGVGAGLTPL